MVAASSRSFLSEKVSLFHIIPLNYNELSLWHSMLWVILQEPSWNSLWCIVKQEKEHKNWTKHYSSPSHCLIGLSYVIRKDLCDDHTLTCGNSNLADEPSLVNGPPINRAQMPWNTSTQNLADEPTLANGPPKTRMDFLKTITPKII